MGFSQALSGLNSAAINLDVIGNNIANSQTVGYKTSRTLFADVFAGAKAGLGTRVTAVLQDFSTGTLESTNRNLDLAISGGGFFRLVQNDQVVYSRNGQLSLANDGYLVNAQGGRLTGFPAGVNTGGNPEELQIPSGALQALATTSIDATFNLDGRVAAVTVAPFDATDTDTYSYANNVTIYDTQGNAHNTTMYFIKTADNNWTLRLSRGDDLAPESANLVFDQNGILDPVATTGLGSFTFPADGGTATMDVALDLGNTTQFGNDFELSSASQNGYASGSLVGIAIDELGNIVGNYSNEQSQRFGTIALANFANAEGLKAIGDNVWLETSGSGQPLLGMAGSGKFGSIESGVVENSNVDLTRELVNLIIAQRNYQANAQTIKVQDEVLQNAVNLR